MLVFMQNDEDEMFIGYCLIRNSRSNDSNDSNDVILQNSSMNYCRINVQLSC